MSSNNANSRPQLDTILQLPPQLDKMVDDGDFQLSGFYSRIIQILRIADEWIQESMDDLRRTVEDIERLYLRPESSQFASFLPVMADRDPQAATKAFKDSLESMISHQKRIGDSLLARVETKYREVMILRDEVRLRQGWNPPTTGLEPWADVYLRNRSTMQRLSPRQRKPRG